MKLFQALLMANCIMITVMIISYERLSRTDDHILPILLILTLDAIVITSILIGGETDDETESKSASDI